MSNEKPLKLKDFPIMIPPENNKFIQEMKKMLDKK